MVIMNNENSKIQHATIIRLLLVRSNNWSNRFAAVRREIFYRAGTKRYFKFECFISTKPAFFRYGEYFCLCRINVNKKDQRSKMEKKESIYI